MISRFKLRLSGREGGKVEFVEVEVGKFDAGESHAVVFRAQLTHQVMLAISCLRLAPERARFHMLILLSKVCERKT